VCEPIDNFFVNGLLLDIPIASVLSRSVVFILPETTSLESIAPESMVTCVPEKRRWARTLPSTFIASSPVFEKNTVSLTDNKCCGFVFDIPTLEPGNVVNAVVTLAKCGIPLETTFPSIVTSSNEIPPKSDVKTFVSTISLVVES